MPIESFVFFLMSACPARLRKKGAIRARNTTIFILILFFSYMLSPPNKSNIDHNNATKTFFYCLLSSFIMVQLMSNALLSACTVLWFTHCRIHRYVQQHPLRTFYEAHADVCNQGCESRRQTFSSITRPRFPEIWKVSALSRSLTLSRPRFGFSRPNPAENESPIANR